MVNSRSTFLIF